jgi:hypothetical protein
MKRLLLVAMLVVGLGSVAACNRDTTPASPNRAAPPDRSAPPRAQNPTAAGSQSANPSGSTNPSGVPGAQSSAGESTASPRPGQGTESQVAQLSFQSVDTNKDGVITQNEALAVPGLDFASADKDNSHTLSHQEFDAAMAKTRPGG